MKARVCLTIVAIVLIVSVCGIVAGQSSAAPQATSSLAFEVASVKVNNSVAAGGEISGPSAGRFTTRNIPLHFILLYAFDLREHQLVGTPDWTRSVRYDIAATYPPGVTPNAVDVRMMVQRLLADRFKLTVHRERQQLPAYALTLARQDGRLGPQLVRSDVDCVQWLAEKRPQIGAGGPSSIAPGGQRPACLTIATRQFITAGTRPMSELANILQSMVARPVLDQTGLTGAFNIDLKWTPSVETSTSPTAAPAPADDGVSIFTALQEQLGLKLEATRAPFDVVVVDRIERATED